MQEQQLRDGLLYIQQLRAESNSDYHSWGKVITSTPDTLKHALNDAWLVVEVWPNSMLWGTKV